MPQPKSYNLNDAAVLEQLYENYWRLLFAICYQKTNNVEASEEIVQDVFVALWKRGGELVVPASIKNYLIKATKTGLIRYYRKKSKNREEVASKCDLCEAPGFGEDTLQHNEAISKFLREDLQLIVDQLPCQCQKVYRLSREEHLTNDEIAIKLNISQKTVKNHLTKALSVIRNRVNRSID